MWFWKCVALYFLSLLFMEPCSLVCGFWYFGNSGCLRVWRHLVPSKFRLTATTLKELWPKGLHCEWTVARLLCQVPQCATVVNLSFVFLFIRIFLLISALLRNRKFVFPTTYFTSRLNLPIARIMSLYSTCQAAEKLQILLGSYFCWVLFA
jgi:hypothetical protein